MFALFLNVSGFSYAAEECFSDPTAPNIELENYKTGA